MKWIAQQFKEIPLTSWFRIVVFCVTIFGGYTQYNANKLNNFIVEVEEQNVLLREKIEKQNIVFKNTISGLHTEIHQEQKQIQFLKKFCDQPTKEFYS